MVTKGMRESVMSDMSNAIRFNELSSFGENYPNAEREHQATDRDTTTFGEMVAILGIAGFSMLVVKLFGR